MRSTETQSIAILQKLIQEKVDGYLQTKPTLSRVERAFYSKIYVRDHSFFHHAAVVVSLFYKQGVPALYVDCSATCGMGIATGVDQVSDLSSAFEDLSQRISRSEPIVQSIEVQVFDHAADRNEEIYKVAHRIWCELFKLDPASQPVQSNFDINKFMKDEISKLMMPCLSRGEEGVRLWNQCPDEQRKMLNLTKLDARDRALARINLAGLNLKEANFSHTTMPTANLYHSDISKGKFVGTDLEHAGLFEAKADGADFSKANLQRARLEKAKLKKAIFCGANLHYTDLKGADLRGADLSSADLSNCFLRSADLRGANLTGCNCTNAQFNKAKFDEHTKLPEDLSQWRDLQWKGEGQNPFLKALKDKASASGPVDFAGMVDSLRKNLDKARIDKAMSMLKKDTFQLYFESKDDSICGIVKSQTDAELLYACQLTNEGSFACCTQNLNVCGGLRGALCKHILVLLIGLSKTEHIDTTTANRWMLASKLEQPALNKDLMTELFLRYKGAESGEIDWRPTETIPEDYYAF